MGATGITGTRIESILTSARPLLHSETPENGGYLKETAFCIALLLAAIGTKSSGSYAPGSNSGLATVSEIFVNPGAEAKIKGVSAQGLVIVALKNCSMFINGKGVSLKSGSYNRLVGKHGVKLTQAGAVPIPLVIVYVLSARQPLTIEGTMLDSYQELDDASSRNSTLIIAINDLELSDVRDLADEGDRWKSSPQQRIFLQAGQTSWLKSGIHRLKNVGSTSARFVSIEW
jgi:hypothetical protein